MSNLPKSNEINKDSTAEYLSGLKQEWVDHARQAGYTNIIWDIAVYLGEYVPSRRAGGGDPSMVFALDNIEVSAFETCKAFSPKDNDWMYTRHLLVTVKKPELQKVSHPDKLAEMRMNRDYCVMEWEWSLVYSDGKNRVAGSEKWIKELKAHFINGDWILKVRNYITDAQAKKERIQQAENETKRVALLSELLVGVDV